MNKTIEVFDGIMSSGKALTLDSLLYTESDAITMADVRVGMSIYGEDGNLYSVDGVYPQGMKECFKMTFSDGTEVVSSGDHIWTFQLSQDIAKGKFRDYTTKELMTKSLYQQTKKFKNWSVWLPLTQPLKIGHKDVLLDPYVLGLLLGDGHFSETLSFSNLEEDIRSVVSSYCQEVGDKFTHGEIDCSITGATILNYLKRYGLAHTRSWDKFVPNEYKFNSYDVRMKVLQGLIDSDGYSAGSSYEYCTSSPQLCEDVKWLVQSLGGSCSVTERPTGYRDKEGVFVDCRNSFRMYVKPPIGVKFHSSEKHDSRYKISKTNPRRSLRSIESVGLKECQCISVSNPTKLFLTNGLVPTHNTQGIITWMLERPQDKYIYISPLLSEVTDRIPSECAALGFVSPNTEEHRTKASHLLELLRDGHNVSFTHSLFENLTKEHLAQIQKNDYVLVIDEEIDFIEPYRGRDYTSEDLLTLETSGHVQVNTESLGRVEWTWKDGLYKGGSYQKLKNMCDIEMLHCAKSNRQMMVTHLPISLITSSKRCIVMTYLFNNSIMARFMEMKGITVKPFTEVVPMYTEAEVKKRAADRIEFILNPSMRKLRGYNLSSQWYINGATKEQLNKVQNAILSVASKADEKRNVMFTFPKDMLPHVETRTRRMVRVKGFVDESVETYWVYCGTKATNEYDYKDTLIYGVNRYCVPTVSGYLRDYGFPVKEDEYALSEMIQWIWRSAIRKPDGKIRLAILSSRMRDIFNHWLDGEDDLLN